MNPRKIFAQHRYFFFLLLAFFIPVLLHLHLVPIAWYDEVMDLEPVGRYFLEGRYATRAWPMEGSAECFMANLPLRELPQFISVGLFGPDIYFVRLIYVLFFLTALVFFYRTVLRITQNKMLSTLLIALFIFDKGVYENLRSARCEPFELALLAASFYLFQRNKLPWLIVFFCACMALIHPKLWMIAAALGIFTLYNAGPKRWLYLLPGLLPILGFFVFIHGDLQGFLSQFLASAKMHSAENNIFARLGDHFFYRYLPYYSLQPWAWLLWIFAHYLAIKNVIAFRKDREGRNTVGSHAGVSQLSIVNCQLSIIFLLNSLFLLLTLIPNYRYNIPSVFLSFLIFAEWLSRQWELHPPAKRLRAALAISVILLPFLLFPFVSRNVLALAQREARDPYPVLDWMEQNLPAGDKTLICGEAIGSYWSLRHRHTEWMALNMPRQFHFSDYKQVWYIGPPAGLEPAVTYAPPSDPEQSLGRLLNQYNIISSTYAGLVLCRVKTEAEFLALIQNYAPAK